MTDWSAPYRRALERYAARKRAALTACIDARLPLALLAGKCALQLELLLLGGRTVRRTGGTGDAPAAAGAPEPNASPHAAAAQGSLW